MPDTAGVRDYDIWKNITKNINEQVKASGKTKTRIAKEIGIAQPTVSQYLSGRSYPGLGTLRLLCKSLDCSCEDILD